MKFEYEDCGMTDDKVRYFQLLEIWYSKGRCSRAHLEKEMSALEIILGIVERPLPTSAKFEELKRIRDARKCADLKTGMKEYALL